MFEWFKKKVKTLEAKSVIERAEQLLGECKIPEAALLEAQGELKRAQAEYSTLGEKWQGECALSQVERPEPAEVKKCRERIPVLTLRIAALKKHLAGLYNRAADIQKGLAEAVVEAHEQLVTEAQERLAAARRPYEEERARCLGIEQLVGRQFLAYRDRYDHVGWHQPVAVPAILEEESKAAKGLLDQIESRAGKRMSITREHRDWRQVPVVSGPQAPSDPPPAVRSHATAVPLYTSIR